MRAETSTESANDCSASADSPGANREGPKVRAVEPGATNTAELSPRAGVNVPVTGPVVERAPSLVMVTQISTVSSGSAKSSLLPVPSSIRTEPTVMFGDGTGTNRLGVSVSAPSLQTSVTSMSVLSVCWGATSNDSSVSEVAEPPASMIAPPKSLGVVEKFTAWGSPLPAMHCIGPLVAAPTLRRTMFCSATGPPGAAGSGTVSKLSTTSSGGGGNSRCPLSAASRVTGRSVGEYSTPPTSKIIDSTTGPAQTVALSHSRYQRAAPGPGGSTLACSVMSSRQVRVSVPTSSGCSSLLVCTEKAGDEMPPYPISRSTSERVGVVARMVT